MDIHFLVPFCVQFSIQLQISKGTPIIINYYYNYFSISSKLSSHIQLTMMNVGSLIICIYNFCSIHDILNLLMVSLVSDLDS